MTGADAALWDEVASVSLFVQLALVPLKVVTTCAFFVQVVLLRVCATKERALLDRWDIPVVRENRTGQDPKKLN